jgi:signal-transduction protein with cAMP-binding, CBS, and nucleotidyltransferase domain
MKIRDALMKAPVVVPPDATIVAVSEAMDRQSVGAVIVVDGMRPIGIITDRDLVTRALARRLPFDARADSVMTVDPICVDADSERHHVTFVFAENPLRRVPVVDHGEVVGMVTLDDLVVRLSGDLYEATRCVNVQLRADSRSPQLPVWR